MMKMITTLLTVFLMTATAAQAQMNMQNMNQEDMQKMMQGAAKMQACFAEVGEGPMKRLQAKGQEMEAEIKALCAAGKRDEAQSTAIKRGRELSESADMKAIRKCGDMAVAMTQNIPGIRQQVDKQKSKHICD